MTDYFENLQAMFPNRHDEEIWDMITIVEESNPHDSYHEKFEIMVNLLTGDGAQGPMPNLNLVQANSNRTESYSYVEDLPFTEEIYLGNQLEIETNQIWEQLQSALPDVDPDYLKEEADRLVHLSRSHIGDFIEEATEKQEYPTKQDYQKRKKFAAEVKSYTEYFNLETFLKKFPDPDEFFGKIENQQILDENATKEDLEYARKFLYNKYQYIRTHSIDLLFNWQNYNLYKICEKLERLPRQLRRLRSLQDLGETKNIPLLQLIAYLNNRKQIKNFIKMKNEDYRQRKEQAALYNLLETCQCCFVEELIPEECFFCQKGCVFCSDCIKRGAEAVIGKGDLKFPCYNTCDAEFSLPTLQMVLPDNTFKHLAQRIASEEIKKANIEGLETCPFCGCAMILEETERIIKCNNIECMQESCRECRHASHIPQRCDEIEYDEDVRRRTYIENKMTEALTRTCYSCGKTFIKSNGCNKMTCSCGSTMCYLCSQPVRDYTHFNNTGCPLHTNDMEIDLKRILENVKQAKDDLGNVEIKFDPSRDIETFYQ